jgi:vacuolar-type H+-ATPase subunit I/STV1
MTAIRIVSALGVAVMTIALIFGFTSGDFSGEGGQILDLIWGRVTLIDLYVGVAIFGVFMFWRERSVGISVAWLVAFVVLGNLATALYVLLASLRTNSVEELLTPVRR